MRRRTFFFWFYSTLLLSFTSSLGINKLNSVLALPIPQEAMKLYEQANQYIDQGNLTQALTTLKQALTQFQALGDQVSEAGILNDIGLVYRNQGQYETALEYAKKALKIRQTLNEQSGIAQTITNIAQVYSLQGNYPQAIEYFENALKIVENLGETQSQGYILTNLGAVYQNLGQYQKAHSYFENSLSIFQQLNQYWEAAILFNNIASNYVYQRQYEQAKPIFEKALTLSQKIGDQQGIAQNLVNLAAVYDRLEQYPKALEFYQQGLELATQVGDLSLIGQALNNMGTVYRLQKQYESAISFYQKALEVRTKIGEKLGIIITFNNLGVAQFESGKLPQATETLYTAIHQFETLRPGLNDENKIALFERFANTYSILQQVLISQNQIEKALEISERGRSRAFVELLAKNLDPEDIKKIQVTPPNINQIKQIAQEQQSTLVEYSITVDEKGKNSKLLIWVITPTGKIDFRSVDLTQFPSLGDNLLTFISQGSQDQLINNALTGIDTEVSNIPERDITNKKLQDLYQILIEPIADLLPKTPEEQVIFIPHQELLLVPFAALNDANGRYLIESHTIRINPSIQALQLTRQYPTAQQSLKTALVVGNPKMPLNLKPLPASENEAKLIANLLKTQPLIGENASETAVINLMKDARIIHLATHGLFDDFTGSGLSGAIALSPSNQADGLLTTAEIMTLKLNANLLVLSACNTASGKITSDGVLGLSRTLIAAGVKNLMVTLWSVDDQRTMELMQTFYQELQQNSDYAQALRQAMLQMIKTHPNPKNWGAFILMG